MNFKESRLYVIIFTFVFSFIFIFIISYVFFINKDKIDQNDLLFEKMAICNSLQIKYSNNNDLFQKYNNEVKEKTVNGNKYFIRKIDKTSYIAKIFIGNGLWGTIKGVVAVNQDVTRIIGVDIISHNETPGLGGRIEEKWFLSQFNDELLKDGKLFLKFGSGNYNHEDSQFDGITGATRTSEYMLININSTVLQLKKISKELYNE